MQQKSSIYLVLGGIRSGKSNYAVKLVEQIAKRPLFIATCPNISNDKELEHRIEKHKQERDKQFWSDVVEEELNIVKYIEKAKQKKYDAILLDCLSLWVNNLLYKEGENSNNEDIDKKEKNLETKSGIETMRKAKKIEKEVEKLLLASQDFKGTLVFVSSEVGLGLLGPNKIAREYVDSLGIVNRTVANKADSVYLLVAGQALRIK